MRLLERKRAGVSEILGTLIMVAITLIAAALVIGWVNGQATVSEGQYGQAVANNVNYLNEHFVILNIQFSASVGSGPGCTSNTGVSPNYCNEMIVSIYNNGAENDLLNSITITNNASVTEAQISATTSSGPWCTPSTHCTISPALQTTTMTTGPTALPTVFTLTLPTVPASCTAVLCFKVGSFYTVQVLGKYGYEVQSQLTVSG